MTGVIRRVLYDWPLFKETRRALNFPGLVRECAQRLEPASKRSRQCHLGCSWEQELTICLHKERGKKGGTGLGGQKAAKTMQFKPEFSYPQVYATNMEAACFCCSAGVASCQRSVFFQHLLSHKRFFKKQILQFRHLKDLLSQCLRHDCFASSDDVWEYVCSRDPLERGAVTAAHTRLQCCRLPCARNDKAPNDTPRQGGAPDLTWAFGE